MWGNFDVNVGQLWQHKTVEYSVPFLSSLWQSWSSSHIWILDREISGGTLFILKNLLWGGRGQKISKKSPKISHIKISSQVGEGKAEEGSKAVLAKSVKLVQSLKADLTTAGSRWWLVMGRFFISEISKGLQICPIQTLNRTCNVIYFIKGITKTFPPNYPTHLSTNLPIYLP